MSTYITRHHSVDASGNPTFERFSRRSGLGVGYFHPSQMAWSAGTPVEAMPSVEESLSKVVLLDEARRVSAAIMGGRSVLVEGDLGAGKSQVLNSVRRDLRLAGEPYAFVDMHHGLDPVRFSRVTKWALKQQARLVVDSYDYTDCFGGKSRSTSPPRVAASSQAIAEHVAHFVDEGGQFIATSHTAPWLAKKQRVTTAMDGISELEAAGKLDRVRVYGIMTPEDMAHNIGVLSAIKMIADQERADALERVTTATESPFARQYRVVKLLLCDEGLNPELLGQEPEVVIDHINNETRRLMAAPADYALLPQNMQMS